MVEAEGAVAGEQPMIAEEPAGDVAYDHIGTAAGFGAGALVEHLVIAPEERARAGDADALARDLAAAAVVQHEIGRALAVPGGRGRVDQMAERVVRCLAEAQEEPGREARRAPGIGLRLALVGEHRVEDMRAEARLGRMAAVPVLVAEEAV